MGKAIGVRAVLTGSSEAWSRVDRDKHMNLARINTADARIARRLMARPQARHPRPSTPNRIDPTPSSREGCLGAVPHGGIRRRPERAFAGRSALDLGPSAACAWFFTWCVILLGSTSNA